MEINQLSRFLITFSCELLAIACLLLTIYLWLKVLGVIMKSSIILFVIIFCSVVYSGEKSLGAHEHGAVKLGIGIENNSAEVDLDGPTESFIDFEYLPKTEKEKKIFSDVKNLWEREFLSLIHFDNQLKCKMLEAKFTQVIDQKETAEAQKKIKDPKKKEAGVHSDIEAHAKIQCAQSLSGTKVQISLKKQFKNIKKLNVDIVGTETKSIQVQSLIETIQL